MSTRDPTNNRKQAVGALEKRNFINFICDCLLRTHNYKAVTMNDLRGDGDPQVEPQVSAICWHLQLRPPPNTAQLPTAASHMGLDCLVMLIRKFYAHLPNVFMYKNDENIKCEKRNPILGLAWVKIPQDCNTQVVAEWQNAKNTILTSFGGASQSASEKSFETLFNSDLLHETIWYRYQFQLYKAWLVSSSTPGYSWDELELTSREMFNESLIIIDRNKTPDESFQKCINDQFGYRRLNDGTQVVCVGQSPAFIRIRYTTNQDLDPIPFSSIKNVYIPIIELQGSTPTVSKKKHLYTLIAVVWLDSDLMRTYTPLGCNITPSPLNAIFGSNEWSLEDRAQRNFMLFYLLCDEHMYPDIGYPEFKKFVPGQEPPVDIWKIAQEALVG
ncbi:hypothetical protein F53441_12307 [Fusarium austroafricanum]|uniref:Uncharacterized protein n=1 Tax=Fusarium austroafricanum TaxID=2364996 RepID=A0A8H4JZF0_9HYPO|nr:hypothetical protein F53441_12307 [Fusarium austroafricanum]